MRSHRHVFRVIYGDTDMMGVVYYANYFRFFEAGRNELLRALGLEYRELEATGYQLPVAEASANYRRPSHYDDELELETSILQVRHSSVRMGYRLTRPVDDELIATGETLHACLGPNGRVSRLPDALRERLSDDQPSD